MMPWREQLCVLWSAFRWVFWPRELKTWARIATVLFIAVVGVAIITQLWLVLLAGFFGGVAAGHLGKKGG